MLPKTIAYLRVLTFCWCNDVVVKGLLAVLSRIMCGWTVWVAQEYNGYGQYLM